MRHDVSTIEVSALWTTCCTSLPGESRDYSKLSPRRQSPLWARINALAGSAKGPGILLASTERYGDLNISLQPEFTGVYVNPIGPRGAHDVASDTPKPRPWPPPPSRSDTYIIRFSIARSRMRLNDGRRCRTAYQALTVSRSRCTATASRRSFAMYPIRLRAFID